MTDAALEQFTETATTLFEPSSRTTTLAGSVPLQHGVHMPANPALSRSPIGDRVEAWTEGRAPEEHRSFHTPGVELVDPSESFAGALGTLTSIGPVARVVVVAHSPWEALGIRAFESLLQEALSRAPAPPRPVAVDRARTVLAAAQSIRVPDRVAVTRSGAIAISFFRGRRYGICECDEDGDTVLTLTDRDDDREAETYVVEPGQERMYLAKIARFVDG